LHHYIINLTHYNLWANTKLTGFLKMLSTALLDKDIISSFNTIRKTLYHVWDAEAIWYNRIKGTSLPDWPSNNFTGTNEEAFVGFIEQSAMFARFANNSNEDMIMRQIKYKSLEGKEYENNISEIIVHIMNHSTFHRGQLITMLRNVGFKDLSSTDYITYLREHK